MSIKHPTTLAIYHNLRRVLWKGASIITYKPEKTLGSIYKRIEMLNLEDNIPSFCNIHVLHLLYQNFRLLVDELMRFGKRFFTLLQFCIRVDHRQIFTIFFLFSIVFGIAFAFLSRDFCFIVDNKSTAKMLTYFIFHC